MPRNKRSREDADTYESDGGFISNDDGNAPKSKKSKKATASTVNKASSGGDEQFWALSSGRSPRRVNLSEFKGTQLVNIREFYEKDDEYLPGKKGISLTIDQYKSLLKAIPQINAILKIDGADVGKEEDDEIEGEISPRKKVKPKKEKSNIEETSDEEE